MTVKGWLVEHLPFMHLAVAAKAAETVCSDAVDACRKKKDDERSETIEILAGAHARLDRVKEDRESGEYRGEWMLPTVLRPHGTRGGDA